MSTGSAAEKQQKCHCGFDALPEELLVEIFGYIDAHPGTVYLLRAVNHFFNNQTMSSEDTCLPPLDLRYLSHLHCRNCFGLDASRLAQFYVPAPGRPPHYSLTHLEITHAYSLTADDVVLLVGQNPALRTLGLAHCPRVNDQSLLAIARHCPALRHLDISNDLECTDAGLIQIALRCPDLVGLRVGFCNKVTARALLFFCGHLRIGNCLRAPSLEALDVSFQWDTFTDDILGALAQASPRLRELHLVGCDRLTSQALVALGRHCGQLAELSVTRCDWFDPACLEALEGLLPQLRILRLTAAPSYRRADGLTEERLRAWARAHPRVLLEWEEPAAHPSAIMGQGIEPREGCPDMLFEMPFG
ncbi:hypothetical protein PAPYR_3788 [Paratrimastix pyriformis]|uniref:Uncharacterized protein n=1 Tax=Paratrimastix pyriformis TaxID=342808 RepID=A0ABQ8UQT2_9EUKA|nr:hypothetical protein PAPYR_3788 [Paratrimastix pyriformis]